MNDERLREAYEQGLPDQHGRPSLDDVAAERLRRLVEREGSDEERLHTLDSLLSSAEGRRELEIVWAASRAARSRRRVGRNWLAAASVVAMAAVGSTWLATRDHAPVVRGDDSPIALVAPAGGGEAGLYPRFVWRAVPNAEQYTLTVMDSLGDEVFAIQTGDSTLTLPDSVHLRVGSEYLWSVQARTRDGAAINASPRKVRINSR